MVLYGSMPKVTISHGFSEELMGSVTIPTIVDNFDHPIILNDGGHLMYYLSSKLQLSLPNNM